MKLLSRQTASFAVAALVAVGALFVAPAAEARKEYSADWHLDRAREQAAKEQGYYNNNWRGGWSNPNRHHGWRKHHYRPYYRYNDRPWWGGGEARYRDLRDRRYYR